MLEELKVSFNSPQCGWMSVGFKSEDTEFWTTTAYKPHSQALSEILIGLTNLIDDTKIKQFKVAWSRNPEAYDFEFKKNDSRLIFTIIEYPTSERKENLSEEVFTFTGDINQIASAFCDTFQQLYEERDIDEFEENWRSEFPLKDYEKLRAALAN